MDSTMMWISMLPPPLLLFGWRRRIPHTPEVDRLHFTFREGQVGTELPGPRHHRGSHRDRRRPRRRTTGATTRGRSRGRWCGGGVHPSRVVPVPESDEGHVSTAGMVQGGGGSRSGRRRRGATRGRRVSLTGGSRVHLEDNLTHDDSVALAAEGLGDDTRGRSLDVDSDLIGIDLGEDVVFFDGVAGLLEDGGDLAVAAIRVGRRWGRGRGERRGRGTSEKSSRVWVTESLFWIDRVDKSISYLYA